MANLFGNWFTFTSKEEIERKEKATRKKAYPLGEEEVKWEDEAIKTLFKDDKKVDYNMVKYVAITLREMKHNSLLNEDDENYQEYEKAFALFKTTIDNVGINDEQLQKIYTLNKIMLKAKTLEDLKL